MNNRTRIIVGLSLVLVGFFWNNIVSMIPKIDNVKPSPISVVVDIEKPSQEILDKTTPIAKLITDKDDKLNLCLFNNVFSKRLVSYETDAQKLNDVYVEAGKNFFGDSIKGKYQGFSTGLDNLFSSVLGTENHEVTDNEKSLLSETFRGLAYCLSL